MFANLWPANGAPARVNDHRGTYEAGFADVLARYHNGESELFSTWTPNLVILRLVPDENMVWINVPETDMEEISLMAQRTDEGENSDEELRAMAMEWVAEHRDQVDAWLEGRQAAH